MLHRALVTTLGRQVLQLGVHTFAVLQLQRSTQPPQLVLHLVHLRLVPVPLRPLRLSRLLPLLYGLCERVVRLVQR